MSDTIYLFPWRHRLLRVMRRDRRYKANWPAAGTCVAMLAGLLSLAACGDDTKSIPGSLSGSISGLTAAGLVLADGSQTLAVNSGATSFTFGRIISSSTAYAVTVQTQPAAETCTVTNGTGTSSYTNVDTVAVTCVAVQPSLHSLGGTVSGLSGSGLVLADGSHTIAVNNDAASFTFGAILTATSAYAVTVQTQPTSQTCSVANGSGSTGTADVANVVVTCADQSYQLGGSVTGLTTSGLVLANGSDTVAVGANATTFTLPSLVATGSSYVVTVKTQAMGEACSVAKGASTMPASDVTTVAVTCTDQPFRLGGTISGLTTSGLVVANGSDTLTVIANATTFTMPAAVNFSSTYALTVQTQPTGLTCSFSGGSGVGASSGTMPANNIANVALVCSPQSYALGGVVSGLSGMLTLANGADTLNVTASGSFQMPASVAYASTYAVTVQTQPATQTCTVSNGTGPMPASAVTNVTVTCAVNTYTIGGSISGLTATGLMLQNNGTDSTNIAANATQFSMNTAVADASAYDITVLAQPSGEACQVADGSNTVAAANVTSVQVTCQHQLLYTTPGAATLTVPSGITSITVTAIGGGGGGAGSNGAGSGGSGALVTSVLPVQAGDIVTIYVGTGGGIASEGSGGGGLTYVGDGANNFVIAGGGGGAGAGPNSSAAVNGGNAGSPGDTASSGGGGGGAGASGIGGSAGAGGGVVGDTGGSSFADITTSGSGSGGLGGGDSVGGLGGAGVSSVIGNGGNGGSTFGAGGGGGGYGGGGGGGYGSTSYGDGGGGGGGGSTGPGGSTNVSIAPAGGPGAGGARHTAGSNGSVLITFP
jgi:hypothetical protein